MPSETSICNRALQLVGTRSTIADLSEDSNEAINCRMVYADTRDELLGKAFWNFAKKTALMSLLKSAPGTPSNPTSTASQWSPEFPAPPWLYEYGYPSDCIQMRKIVQQLQNTYVGVPIFPSGPTYYPYIVGPGAPFEIATDTDDNDNQITVILTNQYQAIGVYTLQITDPNRFSSNFTQALVSVIAAKICPALTGDLNKSKLLYGLTNDMIREARASDGNEGLTVIDNMPDWITCREDFVPGVNPGFVADYGPLYSVV